MGEGGLLRQLGISEKTGSRELRRQIKRWLANIKQHDIWPDCPVYLAEDGNTLVVQHHKAIAPRPQD